jgi:hypothetical protein
MLYKVTPMMPPPVSKDTKAREAGQPRKRRKSAIFDAEGQEVLISLMCLKCRSLKPLAQFGLRKMADGAIRNQPWCRTCRSGAGKPKEKASDNLAALVQAPAVAATLQMVPAPVAVEEEDESSIAVASQG